MGKKKVADVLEKGIEESAKKTAELVNLHVKLGRDLIDSTKIRAIKEGKKLTRIVHDALTRYLEETKSEEEE